MRETSGAADGITRRQALRDAGLAGFGLAAAGTGIDALLARAAEAAPRAGTLKDIEHVIIFMQENRSFDHYFGTLSGVRGFDDKRNHAAFFQRGQGGKTLHPFRLHSQCLPDLTHMWGPQHISWNGGKMNRFLIEHEKVDVPSVYGSPVGTGVETMGYYTRADLPFYYALADAFTICDGYHCSVIGPTDPNRLMSMSATIDPAGTHGGPTLLTLPTTTGIQRSSLAGHFTWTTMPERLEAHGVSWKVYTSSPTGVLDNVLPYFKQYAAGSKLARKGIDPTYPQDFMSDLAQGQLPQVSWLLPSIFSDEHPGPAGSAPAAGESAVRQVLEALLSHPSAWRKTALFITWDENGGFFDHVPPPTPPKGTKGEFLTVATLPTESAGIRGPIGLGIRVPLLVVSPFSRGGLVCSDTFDHTSTLRFLETRFGVEVPNLSSWRRRVTGDLTSTFNFAAKPIYGRPALPATSAGMCTTFAPPKSTAGPFPKQEPGTRKRPSGLR